MRYSGLQRDVLSLYRQCLRVSRTKHDVSVDAIWNGHFSNGSRRLDSILKNMRGEANSDPATCPVVDTDPWILADNMYTGPSSTKPLASTRRISVL